jgi:hypothetical protein
MRIAIQSAVHIAAVIISTSVIAAEISTNCAELPTGDVWPSDAPHLGPPRTTENKEKPATPVPVPPRTSTIAPAEFKFDVPTEFKFNITLTIRPNDKPLGNHAAQSHRPAGFAHRGDCRGQKLRSTHCLG